MHTMPWQLLSALWDSAYHAITSLPLNVVRPWPPCHGTSAHCYETLHTMPWRYAKRCKNPMPCHNISFQRHETLHIMPWYLLSKLWNHARCVLVPPLNIITLLPTALFDSSSCCQGSSLGPHKMTTLCKFNPNPCVWERIWLPKLWRGISLQRLK